MKKNQFWQASLIIFLSVFLFLPQVSAEEIQNRDYSIFISDAAVKAGYTVAPFEDKIKLSLIPDLFLEPTRVQVMELHEPMLMPWNLDRVSEIYQFDFQNKNAYDNHRPFIIQMSYDGDDDNLKQVYFFNKIANSWDPLPTTDFVGENMIRSVIHLPYARIAVFSNPEVMSVGNASWYKYKNGNFAASPDFPKGSKLLVKNLENGKSIEVEINDYGPDRNLHPDRVIDLDKVAFSKIASVRDGIIKVGVDPLYIAPRPTGSVLGVKIERALVEPTITASSTLIMDVDSGEIIFAKNEQEVLSIASLTKLVSMNVFLDTNPDFDQIVIYSKADEEKTWEHVENKYSAMKLNLADGDQLTVKDLFFASLVKSTNNSVETLVRASGVPRAEFINRMNYKAQQWGATSTVFIEPTGLSPQNVSTAQDYAIISKNALAHPKMLEATTLKQYKFKTIKESNQPKANPPRTGKEFILGNSNKLLHTELYITGGKTGYLTEAKYCLMSRIKSGERNIIGVLLKSESRDKSFEELKQLFQYAIRSYNSN
ncbi:MAG: RlpA-like double-psi beta-barrel domain-containing protein [Candidatus Falkowbacteria bacterium]